MCGGSFPLHGFRQQLESPEAEAAIQRALCAIRDAGNCGSVIALTLEDEDKYDQRGARYFAGTRPA
ncbi:2-keto-3-deoxy-L-rhamnonate aldolase RhmA [Variovorax boronicumulans]|uniref:2-keto-3-deoxy-L-rhamnonate aldolase RhmA n=1 Tax=Variovorax boronicumulans TaxID=436515 RepID=A0AAW8CYW9_9BURK|nr:hypothetical protein [Variovorax boronicumulans]MDP9895704.1 2-keto-3-deoxy-L-rhamnonate aldolase RhmA [Variovorax boronicumulans]MDQ0036102.1 2-keto-3-deoxy-L-rhamnonate aldolase RhmA [Variovorax boronicumulans]MDQ0055588.1 2-keto-3-deoxy-L-rhamnonate aldolase RhmA [Variovorax boronicumulans]